MNRNQFTPRRRQFTAIIAALVLVGTGFLLWQRYGPHTPRLKSGKFPEELVSVRAEDGIVNGGVIFTPSRESAKPVAVIWVHGWGVNFYSPTYINIGRALAERGCTCITANTRMHDLGNVLGERGGKRIRGGGYWGVASDEVRDLAAWIDFAEQRAFEQVVLVGHSAGWAAVRHYQSQKQDPRVAGVVLASGAVRAETRPTDQKMFGLATNLISIDRGDDLLRIPNRPFPSFISAATFCDIANTPLGQKDFFGVQTTNADVTRIHCPLLAFFGTREGNIGTKEDLERLKSCIQRLPSGPSRVDTVMIQHADHMYAGEEAQVAETISKWVDSLTFREGGNQTKRAITSTGFGSSALAAELPISAQSNANAKAAVPIEPIPAVLDAFRTHQIVALGEGTENNEQGHAFQLSLIRDPRFPAAVNDIVVEFGNARYQDLMDRFVRGEEIPYDSLCQVWHNTTQPDPIWDCPIYEEFFRAVRSVNASLSKERRLRVLLGDPPIDWDNIHSSKDYGRWDRDAHPAELIRKEILAKGRQGLVLYGDLHFIRRNPRSATEPAYSIVTLLEKTNETKVFTIRTIAYGIDLENLQPDVLSWPRPSLALLRGTQLGVANFSSYYPRPLVVDAKGKPATSDPSSTIRMEEQFDALLYLGPQSTITRAQLSPSLCSNSAYMQMRMGRMKMLGMQMGIDRLTQYCASLAAK